MTAFDESARGLDRRRFLQRSALTAAGVAVASGSLGTAVFEGLRATSAVAATPSYGGLTLQLSWVKKVEFAGP